MVHLEGESGVGRAELARWAHGVLDDRPLSTLRGEGGRPEPGQWLLVEELAELGPTAREQLKAALRARQAPPPPPPPSQGGPRRPHHRALKPILGRSAALASVLHRAVEVADAELPVLILGDPGTGKESLARALHELSGRRGAFVPVDLGALPARLAESELFGHVRGAFTGAERDREGAFRAADGGTLFLDELGNLPLALQVKLLRALQERRVRPLGADRDQPVDVRVLAATNADLESLVRQGRFRADLLGRLDAVTLRLPPLRERAEDIPLLAERFLAAARGEDAPGFSEAATQVLLEHDWPGNIRELGNVVRLAAALAPEGAPVPVQALGPLAPGQRRPVPLLVTSAGEEARWGLDRATTAALRAVSLKLPPLRDRGPLSIRSHVLGGLGGRPIHPEALARLERHPWWGNLPRLHAALAALRAAGEGPITPDTLSAHLPHLLQGESAAPIRLLIGPVPEADGSVGGLREDFHQASVLIGRARSLADLRELARGPGGQRAAAWLRELEAMAGPVPPALLSLGLLPRLSRAHALLTRDAEGLRVHALSGARLPLEAGPWARPSSPCRRGALSLWGRPASSGCGACRAGSTSSSSPSWESWPSPSRPRPPPGPPRPWTAWATRPPPSPRPRPAPFPPRARPSAGAPRPPRGAPDRAPSPRPDFP
ncbi:MAG: sigma 54-interacting transcriptional regulator [Alphaproteobacteria bacterium]|nr:sigma 54-interacting transcriptional regulator [Alphaproteobacteria bacterium]